MEKITLKLYEFYNLEAELNGLTNPQTGTKTAQGLLQEKLPMVTKYWLTDLAKKVAAEKATVEELKNELIKKHGTESADGSISIPMTIEELDENGNPVKIETAEGTEVTKKTLNPAYIEFEKEFNEVLQQEKELEYPVFKLEDFSKVETSENYLTFFQLIKVEQPA